MGLGRLWKWLGRLFRSKRRRSKSPARTSANDSKAGPTRPVAGSAAGDRSARAAWARRAATTEPETRRADRIPAETPVPTGAVPTGPPPEGVSDKEAAGPTAQPALTGVLLPSKDACETRATLRSARRKTVDFVIGLDFGTAATKVVIRKPYLPGQPAAAVSFGKLGHSSSPYLLPSRLRIGSDGCVSIGEDVTGEWMADLKLPLLERATLSDDRSDPEDAMCRAVAYLAVTLREARARFMAAESDTYGRFDIRWALNLGIPSAGYDDQVVRRRFLRAARAAWKASCGAESVEWDSIGEVLKQERQPEFDPGIAIEVVPEVAAQAVGYARSTFRDPGLHLLIDVGAGTLDVCGFVLHEWEGQDRYRLLTATVDRLGVLELHRRRLAVLTCLDRRGGNARGSIDPLTPIGETLADYHPGCPCDPPDVDAEFREQATLVVMRHLMDLKRRRDPFSRRWETGLPVFLCGGGSGMQLFSRVVGEAGEWFRSTMLARGLRLRTLPRPDQLVNDDIGDNLFHRLSVAYGLSFDAPNIGSVSAPYESPDVPQLQKRRIEQDFISKDQV